MNLPARILPTALLILLAASHARAERKTVSLGLVGGITSTTYWGDAANDVDFEIWPTTGFTLAFHLPVFLGLEADMLYVSKSGSTRRRVFDDSLQRNRTLVSTVKLHGLEFPFMIKITAPTESEVQPIFFGGPSLAWHFSRKSFTEYIDIANGGTVIPEEAKPLIDPENLKEYEWSLCLGGGVEWGLGSFQLRFNVGREGLDESGSVDLKTVTAAVMAGFIF